MRLYRELKEFFYFYLDKQDKKSIIKSKGLAILSNLTIILVPLIQKQVLSQIQQGQLFVTDLVLLFLVTMIGTLALVLDAILLNHMSRSIRGKLQRSLLMSSMRHPLEIIEQKGPGAFMVSIFGDTERASAFLKTNYFSTALKCLATFIIFCIASSWSYIFPLIVVPSYLLIIIILKSLNRIYLKEFKSARELVFKLNPLVLEFLENKTSLLSYANIFSYEDYIFSIMKERDKHFEKSELCDILSTLSVDIIKTLSTVLFFCLAVNEILGGRLSIASFIAMTSYLTTIFVPITAVQNIILSLNQFKMYKDRISTNIKSSNHLLLPKTKELLLKDCTFSYQNEKVLDGLSLNINQKISLVGTSGEGKTTLINLLLGERIPQQGECTLGGVTVPAISKFYLFNKIKLYPQNQELFDEDLVFNICLNKEPLSLKDYDDKISDYIDYLQQLKDKLKRSDFHTSHIEREILTLIFQEEKLEWINQISDQMEDELARMIVSRKYYMKERYESLVSKLEISHLNNRKFGQKGNKISGGEKNRVCLARFLLNKEIEYFILDEPFVHLDTISERICLDVLKEELTEAKGMIISHKLNIVEELSDEIVVLQDGTITGRGNHEQLIVTNTLYQALYENFLKIQQKERCL